MNEPTQTPKILSIVIWDWESPRSMDTVYVKYDAPDPLPDHGVLAYRDGYLRVEFGTMPGEGAAFVRKHFPGVPASIHYASRHDDVSIVTPL